MTRNQNDVSDFQECTRWEEKKNHFPTKSAAGIGYLYKKGVQRKYPYNVCWYWIVIID